MAILWDKKMISHLFIKCNCLILLVSIWFLHIGSTDGANNARFFFSETNRDLVLNLFKVNRVDKEKIRRILRHSVQFFQFLPQRQMICSLTQIGKVTITAISKGGWYKKIYQAKIPSKTQSLV